ncbi:protein phosphatase 2C 57 [Tanacetum coccineum]
MALWSPRLQRFILNNYNNLFAKIDLKKNILTSRNWSSKSTGRCCSTIAIDAPSSLSDRVGFGIRWGFAKLQGAREEMEDDAVIVSNNDLDGLFFAAVFDGHSGFSSVKFLSFSGKLRWRFFPQSRKAGVDLTNSHDLMEEARLLFKKSSESEKQVLGFKGERLAVTVKVEFCMSEMKVQCSHIFRICKLALPASKRPKRRDVPKRVRLRESIRQK